MMRARTYGLVLVVALATTGIAGAHPEDSISDQILPPPPTYKANDVTVEEHVGAKLPLDAMFRTIDGAQVSLATVIAGDGSGLPIILTFNYSDCPMLCSVQLNGLTAALPPIALPGVVPGRTDGKQAVFKVGEQFRIITIDLEPKEPLAKLGKLRDRYVARLPEDQRAKALAGGWTFLAAATPGDGSEIRRVADSVGFKYNYVEERAEWAHPAALTFLAANGTVTRYVYGIEFPAGVMRESIFAAGLAQPKTASGFMLRCYHFDPDASSHAHAGVMALRIGAAGFLVLLLTGFGVLHLVRRSRPARPEVS